MSKSKPPWQRAIASAADPVRAAHYFELLRDNIKETDAELSRILSALFSGSPASGDLLVKHPEWIQASLQPELLRNPRREEGLRREVEKLLLGNDALAQIRLFKGREMVRIAARDLAKLSDLPQTVREISAVADVALNAALQLCMVRLRQKYGTPYHLDPDGRWQPTEFAVIGLGKLGGQELNYSSDIDVVFVYSEEGHVFKDSPPKKVPPQALTNHQFFKRVAEALIADVTPSMFRVDLRLRPEGDAGPLVRSLMSYETFYAQWGQAWERMMLIKARGVAGDASLAAEFIETVQPFRYPRSLSEGFLREIAAMKERIETEVVKAGEIDRNVKLGRGGIREIEFVAQSLQVIHGGRLPFLQTPQTLAALEKLVQYNLLDRKHSDNLRAAYCFLRDLEHRLQMENYLQTHTLPTASKSRARLAALLDLKLPAFERALRSHTQNVRSVYDQLFKSDQPTQSGLPKSIQGAEDDWKRILAEHQFREPDRCVKLLAEFAMGPGFVHVSPRTVELAWQLIAKFLSLCPKLDSPAGPKWLSDPDRVLTRLDTFIAEYGSRALLFETWTSNPLYFELLLLLFDRSEFLAEAAIRTVDLVDELVVSGRLRRRKTVEEVLAELRLGREDQDQTLWLRRYHQAELMRIGLRDILGLADFEQNLAELSALAEACLQYALEAVLRKHRLKIAPFAIIGLGKLGGREITYGSDLDLIFVADNSARHLPRLQKLALEVLEMISGPTSLGVAFPTDTRLRPDGEKGLLVNTLRAYEDYYRNRAQLWEWQALSRSRPVAGNSRVGEQFALMAADCIDVTKRKDWKKQIAKMRQRIEKERTPAGQEALAIKTGAGGLMDAEFIAQAFCLEHRIHEPNTLRALELANQRHWLPDGAMLIDNYKELRRVEGILRRWSYAGETVLPDDPAAQYRVAVRCGWRTAREFLDMIGKYRRAIRAVHERVFA